MTITTSYYNACGSAADKCCYLASRYDEERGYKPSEGECWVVTHCRNADGKVEIRTQLGTTAWLTGIWSSPSGTVFVSDGSEGEILMHPDLLAKDAMNRWQNVGLGEGTLDGVWGLDDKFVLTWGASYKGSHYLFCFDGKEWHEMPAPEFEIRAVHGLEKDFLYAVGKNGGVARWDGSQWTQFPTPTDEVLNSVFVAGPDEFYATGGKGILLEGSAHSWGKLASCPAPQMPLLGVAKWGGELWVAGGQLGLFQRDGSKNELNLLKPNAKANSFDAGKRLLIGCTDFIGETADGKSFTAFGANSVLKQRDGKALGNLD